MARANKVPSIAEEMDEMRKEEAVVWKWIIVKGNIVVCVNLN